jgi:hypothetical protein
MTQIIMTPEGKQGAYTPYGGCREFMTAPDHQVILAGGTGSGKSQPVDRRVLTPFGWKHIGKIHAGEYVISVDGTPTRVLGVYPQGKLQVYKITCDDGAETEASADHLWTVLEYKKRRKLTLSNKKDLRQYHTLTTKEILDSDKQYYLPVADAVELYEKELPIPAYTFGVLLGDGCVVFRSTIFNTIDSEIVERVKNEIGNYYHVCSNLQDGKCPTHSINRNNPAVPSYSQLLKLLGIHGAKSYSKFIPKLYLTSSIKDRIALLQGLMDTDGYSPKSGGAVFCSSSLDLCKDVNELVNSLGGITKLSSKLPKFKHNNESKVGRRAYRLTVTLPNSINPFYLSRKASNVKPRTKYFASRRIETITPTDTKECVCISVEHPSNLYITDNYIVTHNTFACCHKMMILCMKYPGVKFLFTRSSYRALLKSGVETFEAVCRMHGWEFGKGPGKIKKLGEQEPREYQFPYAKRTDENGKVYEGVSRIVLSSLSKVKEELGAEYDYVYVNQPEQVTEEDWQFLVTRANGRRGIAPFPQLFGDPNPEHERHWIKLGAYYIDTDGTLITSNNKTYTVDEYEKVGEQFITKNGEEIGGIAWRMINSIYTDNPVIWNHKLNCYTKEGEQMMARLSKSLNSVMSKRLIEGEWCSYEGLVFGDSWDRDKHFRPRSEFNITDDWERYWAIDFGFDDPCCVMFFAKNPHKEQYVCYKYIYQSETDINQLVELIKNHSIGEPRPKLVVADRDPDRISILNQGLGLNVVSAKKGPQSIKAGIDVLISMLRNDEIIILQDSCVSNDEKLIIKKHPIGFEEEVENYRWNPNKPDEPIGGQDHSIDPSRYLFTNLKANRRIVPFIWM